jgi:hypothetical protein
MPGEIVHAATLDGKVIAALSDATVIALTAK